MGVLAGVLALALAGCYAPSVRDCTVRCASADDCAGGQVCGRDGLCAAPEIAGRCGTAPPDASGHDAAAPRDAIDHHDAGIDATATVSLHVQIMGKGSVIVEGIGTCSSLDPQRGNCAYDVVSGVAVTADAAAIQADQPFAMWTSPTCAGQSSRCTFTPVAATTITAKFGK